MSKHPTANLVTSLVAVGCSLFYAGCASLSPPDHSRIDLTQNQIIQPEPDPLSESLAFFSTGLLYEMNANMAAAISNYYAAIQLDPDNESLYVMAAERLMRQLDRDDAESLLLHYAETHPKSAKPDYWLGWLHQSGADYPKAIDHYYSALKKDKSSKQVYTKLSYLLLNEKRTPEAERILKQAIRKCEPNGEFYDMLGGLYKHEYDQATDEKVRDQKIHAAIKVFDDAIAKHPDEIRFTYKRAQLQCVAGDLVSCIKDFVLVEKSNPDNLPLKSGIADSISKNFDDYKKAVEALEVTLKVHPELNNIHYYIAHLYASNGERGKAKEAFTQTIEKAGPESAPYWRLALLQMLDNELTEAESSLTDGLSRFPGNERLNELMAYNLSQQQKYKEALPHYKQAFESIAGDESSAKYLSFLEKYAATAYFAGDHKLAAKNLSLCAEENPMAVINFINTLPKSEKGIDDAINILNKVAIRIESFVTHQQLGVLYSQIKEFEKAIKEYQIAENIAGDYDNSSRLLSPYFYFSYAAVTERTGDFKKAEELFGIAIELNSDYAEAYNYLAYMWAENNIKLDIALELSDKSLELEPGNGAFLDTKGWILYQQGKYDEALPLLEASYKAIDNDPTINDHLGDIMNILERTDEAVTYWENALRLGADEKLTKLINEKLNELYKDLPTEELNPVEESYAVRLKEKLGQALLLPDEIIVE